MQLCSERAKLSLVGFGSNFSMVNEAKRRQGEITARLPFFIECGIVDLLGLGRGRCTRFRRIGRSGNIAQATRHRLFGSTHVRIGLRSVISRFNIVFPRKRFTLRFQHARLSRRIRRAALGLLFLLGRRRLRAKKLGDGFILDATEGIASARDRGRSVHARSGSSSPHHGVRSGTHTTFGGAKSIFGWPIGIDRWGGNLTRTTAFEQLRRERLGCAARTRKVARNVHGLGTTNTCWRHFSLSLLRSLRSSGGLTLLFRHAEAGKQTALFATRSGRFGRLDLGLRMIFVKRSIGIIVRIDRFIRNAGKFVIFRIACRTQACIELRALLTKRLECAREREADNDGSGKCDAEKEHDAHGFAEQLQKRPCNAGANVTTARSKHVRVEKHRAVG